MLSALHALAANSTDTKFEKLMNAHWAAQLKQNPEFATSLGVRDYDHLLSDPSLEAYDAAVEQAKDFITELQAITLTELSEANRLNHSLLLLDLRNEVEASRHGGKYLIMNNRSGPHLSLTGMSSRLPFFKQSDYQSYLKRLALMPEYLTRATARINAGLEAGWVQACAPMKGFEQSIEIHIVDDFADSTFLTPFESRPSIIDKTSFTEMKSEATTIIETGIVPALQRFKEFYLQRYAPKCRQNVGTDDMPGGKEYYDHRVAYFTTTDASADDIHKIGLSEVARIKAEMLEVIKQAKFEGSFEEWLIYLRDTPEFYPKTAEQRMQVASTISKRMDGQLPKLFGKLPRMPYGLKEIPLDIAEKTTTAYYNRPAGDGSRAGFYFVNTTLLDTRPLYQLEALSLHEAVPGHHLQSSLNLELGDSIPQFRKDTYLSAYGEGWGLYCEFLAEEMGMYTTLYEQFGKLTYEMWRACRLVVDTGIHAKGWTREQVINYMAENTALSIHEINTETDRYISWPGQALSYKIGEIKIRELRKKAEMELGSSFDIREFHEVVLEQGTVTLSILENRVNNYIEDHKNE